MKLLLAVVMSSLLLVGCGAGKYQYQSQSNPQQWQGHSIQDLKQHWGQADQVMHTRTGTSFYVYSSNSTANFFNSTTTNFGIYGSDFTGPNYNNNMTLQCTTVFKTDAKNIITNVYHQGSNCGGQWVAKAKKSS